MKTYLVKLVKMGSYTKQIVVPYNTKIGLILQKEKIDPKLRPLINGMKEVVGNYRIRKNCTFILSTIYYGNKQMDK